MVGALIFFNVLRWLLGYPAGTAPMKLVRPAPPAKKHAKARNTGADVEAEPQPDWPEHRLEVVERLWGEGFLVPGGGDFVMDAVRPMQLDESKGMLEFNAGLGGGTREMARDIGVWVSGAEFSPELVEIAQFRSKMAGMTRKAAVELIDPENPKLPTNKFNAAIALDGFLQVEDKQNLFVAVQNALRVDGHFLTNDYVLASDGPLSEATERWLDWEPYDAYLWTAKQTFDCLSSLEFDVRIAEDITKLYRNRVLNGWRVMIGSLTRGQVTPLFAAHMVRECEYWMYKIAALDSGEVRVYRFHALRERPQRTHVPVDELPRADSF